ncbi:MAG: DNA-directed RNA polymerase subunit omega [Acidobacteria bacterium]|nr:MAG: DNA-directed RNA polymerase subunit omega [Acidobacteriota bacterium]
MQQETLETPTVPETLARPIESRFLFVDIAALRAKQLRRGARPRLPGMESLGGEQPADTPRKAERVAMEEVRRGLVFYELPDLKGEDK